jgi:hypothetical protein
MKIALHTRLEPNSRPPIPRLGPEIPPCDLRALCGEMPVLPFLFVFINFRCALQQLLSFDNHTKSLGRTRTPNTLASCGPHYSARNSNRIKRILHNIHHTPGVGVQPRFHYVPIASLLPLLTCTGKVGTDGPLRPAAHSAKMATFAETVPPRPVSKPVERTPG